jgi:hypothetical protein
MGAEVEHTAPASLTSPEELAEHAEAYQTDALERQSRATKKLDEELRRLQKLEKEYRKPLERALEREGGAKAEAMKRELQDLMNERDLEAAHRKAEELKRRHGGLMKRAMAGSGIDRKGARRKLLSAIGHSETPPGRAPAVEATSAALPAAEVELIETDSLGFSLVTAPPKPPAPPGPKIVDFDPPYPQRFVSTTDEYWARAVAATGRLFAYSESLVAGSFQTLASVGAPLTVGPKVRRVRVEVNPGYISRTSVIAVFGYASVEAKFNLIVRDQSREVASDYQGMRSIAVVFWVTDEFFNEARPIACEFDHALGTSATYSVIAEAETWAGGVGLPAAGGGAVQDVFSLDDYPGFRALLYT